MKTLSLAPLLLVACASDANPIINGDLDSVTTRLSLSAQERLGTIADGENKTVAYTPTPEFRAFTASCATAGEFLKLQASASSPLRAYVVDSAANVLARTSGENAELGFACPSAGSFDFAFRPMSLQAITINVGLTVVTLAGADAGTAKKDAGTPARDAGPPVTSPDGSAPSVDAGPTDFTPAALFSTGVPVTFNCSASYLGPAVFPPGGGPGPQPVLPASFSQNATIKFVPRKAPPSPGFDGAAWRVSAVFAPATPESMSKEFTVGLNAATDLKYPVGSKQSFSDATKLTGSNQNYSSGTPERGTFEFLQTSASHFSIKVYGQYTYKGYVPVPGAGYEQKLTCTANY
jgi:hypothetical protein